MSFLRKHYLIILILIVALFLRLYNLSSTITFLEDEGRDLLIMNRMIGTGLPVLLGPQTSTGSMYLGPLYYYIVTPALFLARMNPLGPIVFIALTGVLTVWLLYMFTSKWFGKLVGICSALMYAILPLPVIFTRNSWNPNLAPLFSLLIIWYLIKIIEEKEYTFKNFFLVGILSGSLIQMHYMALLFLAGVCITLIIYLRRSLLSLAKGVVFAGLGFILILSPFIAFEVRNDFVNTRAITRFIEAKEEHNIRYSLPTSLFVSKVTATTTRLLSSQFGRDALTPDPIRLPITISIVAILLFGLFSAFATNDKSSRIYKIIFLTFIIPLLFTGIYQENIHLHYLGFFFPLTYITVASTFRSSVKGNKLFILFILGFTLYSIPQLSGYLRSPGNNQVIRSQEVISYILNSVGDAPYNLVSASGTSTTPYLYFAATSSHPPTTARATTIYLVCQGKPCDDNDLNTPLIFITGPAHPSLGAYLGHPLMHRFEGDRVIISNEHVSHGAWVAKINVKIDQ
jgi:4-amino-4-deoxy-L-arabinose transferase-like glycosyltransferase